MRALDCSLRNRRFLLPVAVLRDDYPADMALVTATALLDTGATASGIGPRIIAALNLESWGKKPLRSATDEAFVAYYLFRIGLFTTSQLQVEQPAPGDLPYVFEALNGFSWGRHADFDVILGMDILSQCDVSFGRDGHCVLRFG